MADSLRWYKMDTTQSKQFPEDTLYCLHYMPHMTHHYNTLLDNLSHYYSSPHHH